ncbi:MAG: hypothetical protein IKQ20_14580 [Bacteroidales bacterium]|nr:hypothetical protein [Bacteroidales bacterium]
MEQTPRNPETMSWDDIRQVLAENSIQLEKNRLLLEENRLQLEENRKQLELSRLQMLDTDRRIKETDRQMKETDLKMQETDRRIKETDRQMKETDLKMQETDRQMKETGLKMQETDRQMKETDRLIKENERKYRELAEQFTSTIGHITEGIVEPAAMRVFQEAGYDINRYYRNLHSKMKNNRSEMEVDLLMLDDTIAIVVEIKTDCRKKDIDHFMRQMPKFKRLFPEYRDKEVLAAIAALNYDKDARQHAHEQGMLVISTTDGDLFTLEPCDKKSLQRF